MNSKSLYLMVSAFLFAGGAALSAPGCGRSSLGHEGGAPADARTPLGDGGAQGGGGGLQGGGGGQSSGGISGKGGAGVGGVAQGGITGMVCGDDPGQPCCGSNPGACTTTLDASAQADAPVVSTGGIAGTGGRGSTGGISSTGGVVATGGKVGSGGIIGTGGVVDAGGIVDAGSTATGGSTSSACTAGTPLTGGTQYCNGNFSGSYGSSQWSFWENGSAGCITTYSNGAFSASWNNSGDVLAQVGLQWDSTKTYDQLGTISGDFAETKAGTASSYSYIGVYGWSVSPCVEYYIIEDSYDTMPVRPGTVTNMGTYDLDGGTYILYESVMTGTGISDCSRVSNWRGLYSVRQTARQCGHISISQHFAAWTSKFMTLGKMEEAKIFVEAMGGTGSIDFTTATVTSLVQ